MVQTTYSTVSISGSSSDSESLPSPPHPYLPRSLPGPAPPYLIGHAIHLIGHRIEFALQIRLCGAALAHGRGVGRKGVAGVVVCGNEGVVDQRLHGKLIVIAAVRDDLIYPGQAAS